MPNLNPYPNLTVTWTLTPRLTPQKAVSDTSPHGFACIRVIVPTLAGVALKKILEKSCLVFDGLIS